MTDSERPKRPVGRPPGLPKTGGRKKGIPNKSRAETVAAIVKHSDPIGFLEKVSLGLLVECRGSDSDDPKASVLTRPTMEQRMTATAILSKKVLPDCRALELEIANNDVEIIVNLYPHGPDKQHEKGET